MTAGTGLACVDCGRPSGTDQLCDTCSREIYLYRVVRCDHVWPAELTPSAICGGCGLEYREFEECAA